MAWSFVRAVRRGVELIVTLSDGETSSDFAYTYPMVAGQTAAKFKTAVKKEIVAHLEALNGSAGEEDVTEEYRP